MNLTTCIWTNESTQASTIAEELHQYDLLSPNILTLEELIQILEEVAKVQSFTN